MGRSPITWVGGKFYLANKIIAHFPAHERYIEPFGGAAHVLFRKEPAPLEIYNDVDGNLVNFFSVVKQDPEALFDELDLSLLSRETFERDKATMREGTAVQRAAKFYRVNGMCFGGNMREWAFTSRNFYNYEPRIRAAHERLKGVYIEHRDFRWIIPKYDHPDALFLCDPPYMFNGHRGRDRTYVNEMADADHADLVALLKGIKGKFVLSGYENALYDCFERVEIGASNMNIKKTVGEPRVKKMEYVWKNF